MYSYLIIIFLIACYIYGYVCIYIYNHIKKVNHLPKILFPVRNNDIDFPVYEYENNIDKVFHRTHLNQKLIDNFKDVEDKIKKLHPDYQIINYVEEDVINFIKKYYNQRILTAYNSIDNKFGAAKADLFRYLVIYAKGGIYIDIKSGPVKNIDLLLKEAKNNILVSHERENFNDFWMFDFPKGEMLQWCVIAPKGHPVVRELIIQSISNIEKDYKKEKNYIGGRSVIFMTGPMMFTDVIKNSKEKNIKYLDTNMNKCFRKHLTSYDKEKLKKLGTIDYHIQKTSIIKTIK